MRYLTLIILFISFTTHAQRSQLQSYQKQLDYYKEKEKQSSSIIKALENLADQYSNYEHKNIIQQDQKILDESKKEIQNLIKKSKNASATFLISSVQSQIDKLHKYIETKEQYDKQVIEVKNIEDMAKYRSKRFQKFIKMTKEGKDAQQTLLKAVLFKEEKRLANKYLKHRNYTLREKNVYELNNKNIEQAIKKIDDVFKYPRQSQEVLSKANDDYAKYKDQLDHLNDIHQQFQYDVTLGTWESGLFSCEKESEPQYWKFNNQDNLVALVNNGQIKSVLKIDKNHPHKKEYIYKCSDYAMFGGCLDNTRKKLCELKANCKKALKKMEDSFDKNKFFTKHKKDILNSFKTKRDKYRNQKNYINMHTEWEKMGRIGQISTNEYKNKFNSILSQVIDSNEASVDQFIKKINAKLNKEKKKLMTKYKDEQTQKAIDYFINDTKSFYRQLSSTDDLEKLATIHCYDKTFCENYKKWDELASFYDDVTPIENLVSNECPRLVLRMDQNNTLQEEYSCNPTQLLEVPSAIKQLKLDTQIPLDKLNK